MKTTSKIFWILALFFLMMGCIYGLVTGFYQPLGVETVGFPAILMLSGLAGMIAVGIQLSAKRFPDRPEDRLDGEVEEEAGVQGSFSPYSWWPLVASLGASMIFLGVAAGWWIAYLGAVPVLVGVIGWVMEFSVGKYRH